MAQIELDIRTDAPPQAVRAALLDFSERRPELWPGLPASQYDVYEVGDTWAEVREGYRGPIWNRERYDWSQPDRIVFTAIDSGFARPGGYVTVEIQPAERGGSTLHVVWVRQGKRVFGRLFVGLMMLTRGAAIRRSFELGLARLELGRARSGRTRAALIEEGQTTATPKSQFQEGGATCRSRRTRRRADGDIDSIVSSAASGSQGPRPRTHRRARRVRMPTLDWHRLSSRRHSSQDR